MPRTTAWISIRWVKPWNSVPVLYYYYDIRTNNNGNDNHDDKERMCIVVSSGTGGKGLDCLRRSVWVVRVSGIPAVVEWNSRKTQHP